MRQPDRLIQQLAQAQAEEVAAYERSVAAFRAIMAEYDRRLADARGRLAETERTLKRRVSD